MKYEYEPKGTCSKKMIFDIEDGIIKDLEIIGGCNGNLKGIKALVIGMNVKDVAEKLKGIECGMKNTSCPDQISKGLLQFINEKF